MQQYHQETDLEDVTKDSFYMQLNHNETYSVLKFDEDEALYFKETDINDLRIDAILKGLNASPLKRNLLSSFISRLMAHTLKGGSSQREISMSVMYAILKESLQRDALFSKQEVITINKKIETLVKKRENLLAMR